MDASLLLLIPVTAFAASLVTLISGFGLGTLLLPVFALFFPLEVAILLTAVVHLLITLFKGQLAGLVQLDSLASSGTYGIGPLEFLRGELLLWDGRAYVATAVGDDAMVVEELPESRAPFFVHQEVVHWTEVDLPDSVQDHGTLDAFLTSRYAELGVPFAFKLEGRFDEVATHLVDVPPGSPVAGPEDAHRWNKHFHYQETPMDMLGFFSTKHQAVFTHHDSHIHMHALTADRTAMGHVEEMRFLTPDVRLFVALPDR